ncbi:hypothetical protein QA802_35955 [Streptomyces sp. B21-105]|uniref:hypothetical protein n=1 Tax=Streptomyces sp. B21-105 TaxID=3039417 RepID=UPI002FF2CDB0
MSSPTGEVYRVDWLPGTDILHGTCHCGAQHTEQDPVRMWEWMLAHPDGHEPHGHAPHGHAPHETEPQKGAPHE